MRGPAGSGTEDRGRTAWNDEIRGVATGMRSSRATRGIRKAEDVGYSRQGDDSRIEVEKTVDVGRKIA